MAGGRLDAVLAKLMPDYSRSRLSSWIKEGAVIVNDKPAQPKDKMIGGELIAVTVRPSEENLAFTPEPMDLDIIMKTIPSSSSTNRPDWSSTLPQATGAAPCSTVCWRTVPN